MKKLKIAIIGYGNIGKFAADAVNAAPDMELAVIMARNSTKWTEGIYFVSELSEIGEVDAAILTVPSRLSPAFAEKLLNMGISVVDSYDIHESIWDIVNNLDGIAKANNAGAIIAAGWDPGSDSVVRALLEAVAPVGITYTNFGPGMSMGHTVAAKSIEGVKDALSMTIPLGTGIHRRMVYIETEEGADFEKISAELKNDPYFAHDETHVTPVENVSAIMDMGHGVHMTRKGVSGCTHNQLFEFNMKINNPALTAQILVASVRAVVKRPPGAYTMIDVPVIDFLAGEREELIKKLV